MISIINYLDLKNLTIGRLNNKVYFSITENFITKFVFLPEGVFFDFGDTSVKLEAKTELSILALSTFLLDLEKLKKSTAEQVFKKKLRLKGLGFRISVDMSAKELSLKLGYSHLINIRIPAYITNLKVKKNLLLIESFDDVALGDFVKKISDLRKADSYKGKGFSGQYEKKKLKVIKKK